LPTELEISVSAEKVRSTIDPLKKPIVILGAGALGSLYGAMLAEAGQDVFLIRRSREYVEAIRQEGLRISGVRGDRIIQAKVAADPESVGKADLILFTVKSFHTEQAAKDCLPMIGPQTTLLSLQNGVRHIETIANIVGREKVLGGSSTHNAVQVEPGHVSHAMDGLTTVGELDGSVTERVTRISKTLNDAGIKTETSDNILGILWTKLLICVSAITLNGVLDLPGAIMIEIPELRDVFMKAAQEVVEVAKAQGIRLVVDDPMSWLINIERKHKAGKSSMREDLEKGAGTEVDAFSGFIVREGRRLGIPTPYNEALVGIIKGLERKKTGESISP
jgi:2-dehydropantoate 2-reductase